MTLTDFRRRTLTAALLAPIVIAFVHAGSGLLMLFLAFASILLFWEWEGMWRAGSRGPVRLTLVLTGLAMVAAMAGGRIDVALFVCIAGAVTTGATASVPREGSPVGLGAGALYIGIPIMAFIWLRALPDGGREIALWLLAVIWVSDIAAYVFGAWIGGPRLAVAVSPNKTWAGAIAGLCGGALAGGLGGWLLAAMIPALGVFIGALMSVAGQGGDLVESAIKRKCGVKDSGKSIPGHGGVLDRVDGLLFAAPVLAFLVFLAEIGDVAWR